MLGTFVLGCAVQAAGADTTSGGVRFMGNTWNQALIALPDNPRHAVFISQGGQLGNVTLHMLQTDSVVLEIDGKRCALEAEPGEMSALWLNDYINNVGIRVDGANPYVTQTVTFNIARNGQAFNFNQDPIIAKSGPFRQLPRNMSAITVKVSMSPGLPTTAEALAVDFVK